MAPPDLFETAALEPCAQIVDLQARLKAGDQSALAAFWWALRERGTPLVEEIAGSSQHVLVTFVYRDETAKLVVLMKGPEDPRTAQLARLPGTDLWARSYRLPADGRFTYSFAPDLPLALPLQVDIPKLHLQLRPDPLNPHRVGLHASLCVLPNAPRQPSSQPARDIPTGAVQVHEVTSKRLGNARRIHVYTPAGYDEEAGPYPLVVLFDGVDYLSGIPAPTILDNLIAQRRLPPTMALMIDPVDRDRELAVSQSFTEVVAREIVPFVQRRYRATADPSAVVVGGFSLGGVGAVWAAFCHPEVFGNVLAQSDAVVPHPSGGDTYAWLARQIAAAPRKAIRFHLEDGRIVEANQVAQFPPPFRYLHPVLAAGGYQVTCRTFTGGHHPTSWRERLGDALEVLLGGARPQHAIPSMPTDDVSIEDLGPSLSFAVLRAAALGGADEALRTFREGLDEEFDRGGSVLDVLGYELLYVAEQPRVALAVFEECVRRFPASANAHLSLAEATYVAGDRVDAISCCQKALALEPNNEKAANLLELLEQPAWIQSGPSRR